VLVVDGKASTRCALIGDKLARLSEGAWLSSIAALAASGTATHSSLGLIVVRLSVR
jgi:hypothetical protein